MLTTYTRGAVSMGSGRTSGVWMDAAAVVAQRHQERVARSLAAFAARGVPRAGTSRRRRSWGEWLVRFAGGGNVVVTVNGDRIR